MKLTNKASIVCIIMLSLFISKSSFALGKIGHKVVCKIAYEHLDNQTRLQVNELVSHLPKKHKKLINKYNHKNANTEISYIDTCSWADAIKRDKSYNKFKPWHYINVSRSTTEITSKSCEKHCITTAIEFHKKALSTENSLWKKLQALMFISHWVGDIHQPMHVNFASDRGGNNIKIKYKESKCKTMHWLWDECLLYPVAKIRNQSLFFQKTYDNVMALKDDSSITTWQKDSLYVWATESLTIARMPSVQYCSITKNNVCLPISNKKIMLSKSYQIEHQKILERRILQAGVRLSQTLKDTLK